MVPPGVHWVSTGLRRARGDAVACPGGPYINRAPIRDNQAICRAPTGPIVPKHGSDGNSSEPDMARSDPTSPDGSLDCPVYQCTTDIRTDTEPYGTLAYPDGTQPNPSSLTPDWVLQFCDTETSEPDHLSPLARAPRDGITACDQVPHSDFLAHPALASWT